jgi:transposase
VFIGRTQTIQLDQPVIHADETTVNVVSDDNVKSYMWVYATGADLPKDKLADSDIKLIVLFDYHNSRVSRCAIEYLNGYQGYLQVNGYASHSSNACRVLGSCEA